MSQFAKAAGNPAHRHPWAARFAEAAAVVGLCMFFAGAVISQARSTSATFDETTHLPAGYSYWKWRDFRLSPEHPPLIKLWATLPLLMSDVWPSTVTLDTSRTTPPPISRRVLERAWGMSLADPGAQWFFGHFLLYGVRDDAIQRAGVDGLVSVPGTAVLDRRDFFNDADGLLFRARMQILVLGLALGLLIFRWAREIYGVAGGILALAFYAFDPNFIAHSGLVTTDVGFTLFFFGAIYFLWRSSRRQTRVDVALTALCFGLAFVSKFSAVLLLPTVALLVGVVSVSRRRTWLGIGMILVCLGTAYGTLWGVYGFRYSAAGSASQAAETESLLSDFKASKVPYREPGHFPLEYNLRRARAIRSLDKLYPDDAMLHTQVEKAIPNLRLGVVDRGMLAAARYHLLPEAYLFGLANANMHAQARYSFLLGRISTAGWWYYFPVAFLLKTPLLTLMALGATLWFSLRRREGWILAFLMLPAGLYLLSSMAVHLNIGHRHLLPVYPFLYVLCGGLVLEWRKQRSKLRRPLAGIVLVAIALGSVIVFAPPWRPQWICPHYLSYFNELAGGPRQGYRRLVDSNLDWGQDLKSLKTWVTEHGITEPINLCYFGTADPHYYAIPYINLPGGYSFEEEKGFGEARVPGYLAISATSLQGVYLSPTVRAAWADFLAHATLVDTVGYSIFIYHIVSPAG